MNDKIFDIAKQADLIQWDLLPSGARTPDYESVVKARKFATLIIQECAKRLQESLIPEYEIIEGYNEDWNFHIYWVIDTITNHFGVTYD